MPAWAVLHSWLWVNSNAEISTWFTFELHFRRIVSPFLFRCVYNKVISLCFKMNEVERNKTVTRFKKNFDTNFVDIVRNSNYSVAILGRDHTRSSFFQCPEHLFSQFWSLNRMIWSSYFTTKCAYVSASSSVIDPPEALRQYSTAVCYFPYIPKTDARVVFVYILISI